MREDVHVRPTHFAHVCGRKFDYKKKNVYGCNKLWWHIYENKIVFVIICKFEHFLIVLFKNHRNFWNIALNFQDFVENMKTDLDVHVRLPAYGRGNGYGSYRIEKK